MRRARVHDEQGRCTGCGREMAGRGRCWVCTETDARIREVYGRAPAGEGEDADGDALGRPSLREMLAAGGGMLIFALVVAVLVAAAMYWVAEAIGGGL